MHEHDRLAERFAANRANLRAVAHRCKALPAKPTGAVRESWLRVSRAGTSGIENLHQNGADPERPIQLEVRILG